MNYLDSTGRLLLRKSRVDREMVDSTVNYGSQSAFQEARPDRSYFGPVYFRSDSEPFLTIARHEADSSGGVVLAEINLRFMWDVISRIKIGQSGYAFVVDRNGVLLAHPGALLVLRKTDLSTIPHIADQLHRPNALSVGGGSIVRNFDDRLVFSASQPIVPPGWHIWVEQPMGEAMEPLRGSAVHTIVLLVVGIGLSIAPSLAFGGRLPVKL